MLNKNRRVNKKKILKSINKPQNKIEIINDYNLSIANLRIDEEKRKKRNKELSESINEKNKRLNLDHSACKIIENEHFDKVDKIISKKIDLKNDIEISKNKLTKIKNEVSVSLEIEENLKKIIPKLKDKKIELEKSLENKKEYYNSKISKKELILKKIDKSISISQLEKNKLDSGLELIKKEFSGLKEKILLENKILSIKKKDLEIYEARFRKKYNKEIINI